MVGIFNSGFGGFSWPRCSHLRLRGDGNHVERAIGNVRRALLKIADGRAAAIAVPSNVLADGAVSHVERRR